MKILSISIVRTDAELNDPVPLTTANDLSSFGFFQRQVGCIGSHLNQLAVQIIGKGTYRPLIRDASCG
jgi:hypothetical protein